MNIVKCGFLSVILIIVLTFFISSCKTSGEVATTNSAEYNKEEYQLVMASLKNDVILYYSENYDETDFSDSVSNNHDSSTISNIHPPFVILSMAVSS